MAFGAECGGTGNAGQRRNQITNIGIYSNPPTTICDGTETSGRPSCLVPAPGESGDEGLRAIRGEEVAEVLWPQGHGGGHGAVGFLTVVENELLCDAS